MSKETLFVFLICFWTIMAILSNMFAVQLSKTDITEITNTKDIQTQDSNNFWDILNTIPGVNLITPLFRIMAFQYTDSVPIAVTLFLDMTGIFTVFVIALILRGV